MPRQQHRVTYLEDSSPKDFRMRTPESPAVRHFRSDDADPSSRKCRTKLLMLHEHEVANLERDRRFLVETVSDETDVEEAEDDSEAEDAAETAPSAKAPKKKRAAKKAAQ